MGLVVAGLATVLYIVRAHEIEIADRTLINSFSFYFVH